MSKSGHFPTRADWTGARDEIRRHPMPVPMPGVARSGAAAHSGLAIVLALTKVLLAILYWSAGFVCLSLAIGLACAIVVVAREDSVPVGSIECAQSNAGNAPSGAASFGWEQPCHGDRP